MGLGDRNYAPQELEQFATCENLLSKPMHTSDLAYVRANCIIWTSPNLLPQNAIFIKGKGIKNKCTLKRTHLNQF